MSLIKHIKVLEAKFSEKLNALDEKIPKQIEATFREVFVNYKSDPSLDEDLADQITFPEGANLLKCERATIYNMIKRGELHPKVREDKNGNKIKGMRLSRKEVIGLYKTRDRKKK